MTWEEIDWGWKAEMLLCMRQIHETPHFGIPQRCRKPYLGVQGQRYCPEHR